MIINCPVTGTVAVWQNAGSQGPVFATINSGVRELVLVLNRGGGEVVIGTDGLVRGGYWTMGIRGIRNFGSVRGVRLVNDGQLGILTAKSGQKTLSIPAKDGDLTTAAQGQLGAGEIARMDINDATENDLTTAEQQALAAYLANNTDGSASLTVESIFDVSVDAYSFQGGSEQKGTPLTSLSQEVPVQIGNTTGNAVRIVRLHEEKSTEGTQMTATAMTDMVTDEVVSFNSSLFSKYVMISNGEEIPAESHDLPDSNLTWTLGNGVLTIRGTGDMPDFDSEEPAPWQDEEGIHTVLIETGVTGIGTRAFEENPG